MNFTRPFNVIPRIVACNSITLSSSLNSGQLHKNKDHRKNGKIYDFHQIFMKYKGNKKLIVYAISYEPKSTRSLNKISKRSAPRKYTISKTKFSSSPQISGRRRGAVGRSYPTTAIQHTKHISTSYTHGNPCRTVFYLELERSLPVRNPVNNNVIH